MKVVLGHALFIALRLTVTQHSTLEMLWRHDYTEYTQ